MQTLRYPVSRNRFTLPDGICVDAQGHLWNAWFAERRLVRYSPQGMAVGSIELPVTNPTCACLGGPDFRTLYITTARKFLSASTLESEALAGAVLALEVQVPGLPEHRFRI